MTVILRIPVRSEYPSNLLHNKTPRPTASGLALLINKCQDITNIKYLSNMQGLRTLQSPNAAANGLARMAIGTSP